jgi:opacity protein-like surface antigen
MSWLLTGVLSVVIVGMARPAAAQDDAPKAEVAGGWNYIAARDQAGDEWNHLYKGGFGEVAVNLNNRWGVVGNIAYDQKTEAEIGGDVKFTVVPYLFGVRFSHRVEDRATPFLHFLAGATRIKATQGSDSVDSTTFSWQFGGGVNIPVNSRVFARAGGDYLHIYGGDDDNQLTGGEIIQGLRISAGVGVSF